jgi:nucleotidyltransferase/DNA polymerase involved in DNA repair
MSVLLPHLAIEWRPLSQDGPIAITDGIGSRRCLIACNASARELGISAGADVPSAMMREPNLLLMPRSKGDERRSTCIPALFSTMTKASRLNLSIFPRCSGGLDPACRSNRDDFDDSL